MKIIEANEGLKIPYEVSGNFITFGNELSLNLAKWQIDNDTTITIYGDRDGRLINASSTTSKAYVAEIAIPAKKYIEVKDESSEGETKTEVEPFNIDDCTLTLWALVAPMIYEYGE